MLLKMTLLLFTAAAAVKDRQCARIPNALIFIAACNGVFLQLCTHGGSGILKAAMGAVVPLILCGWLFALAMLGAGDLKLLMAVGVYTGPFGIVKVLFLALISGAVLSLAKILKYGLFRERMMYLFNYVQQMAFGRREPYMDMSYPQKSEKWTIHFAVPVFLAVVIFLAANMGKI